MPELKLNEEYVTINDRFDVKILAFLVDNNTLMRFPAVGIMTQRSNGLQRVGHFSMSGEFPSISGHDIGWNLKNRVRTQWFAVYPEWTYNSASSAVFNRNRSLRYLQTIEVDFIGEWYHKGFSTAVSRTGVTARYISSSLAEGRTRIFGIGEQDDILRRTNERGKVNDGSPKQSPYDIMSVVKGYIALHKEEGFDTEEQAREAAGDKAIGFIDISI